MTLRRHNKSSVAHEVETIISEARRGSVPRQAVRVADRDQRSSEEADPTVGDAATDLEIRRRYQDATFARGYLAAYAGPFRISSLAAWIIAARERYLVARALRACRPPPAMLLDMPCGTGKLAEVLAKVPSRVIGADLSVAMMDLARGAYPASHFNGFVCSSGERLPFRAAAFDTVVCLRLMHLVPPDVRRNITKELARIASRRVIVSFGVINSFQRVRLKIRHAIIGGESTPHPVRLADLRKEIEAAGLRITSRWRILPVLSCECLLTLEKQQPQEADR
jgi:SAM-dependent methyltransferase